jgi:hypothetical protein
MKQFGTGSKVKWDWGNGEATGEVAESYTEKVTKQIDGNEVTRKADNENPAYLIKQDDGQTVLKSHSELESTN